MDGLAPADSPRLRARRAAVDGRGGRGLYVLPLRPLKARSVPSTGASQKLWCADAAVMRELGRPLCYPGGPPVRNFD